MPVAAWLALTSRQRTRSPAAAAVAHQLARPFPINHLPKRSGSARSKTALRHCTETRGKRPSLHAPRHGPWSPTRPDLQGRESPAHCVNDASDKKLNIGLKYRRGRRYLPCNQDGADALYQPQR